MHCKVLHATDQGVVLLSTQFQCACWLSSSSIVRVDDDTGQDAVQNQSGLVEQSIPSTHKICLVLAIVLELLRGKS